MSEELELNAARSRIAYLAKRLIAAEDDHCAAQGVAIDALAKLDLVREIATNWADGDCRTIQPYGEEILKVVGRHHE